MAGGEDRISGLPDELLHAILARLGSVSSAVRTGVLSRRWRHVWAPQPELVLGFCLDAPLPPLPAFLDAGSTTPSPPAPPRPSPGSTSCRPAASTMAAAVSRPGALSHGCASPPSAWWAASGSSCPGRRRPPVGTKRWRCSTFRRVKG
ncbi:unnamed protein product [Urochloa humidicola]